MQFSGLKQKYKNMLLKTGAWLKWQQQRHRENYSLILRSLKKHYQPCLDEIKSIAKELNVKEEEVREMEYRLLDKNTIDYSE